MDIDKVRKTFYTNVGNVEEVKNVADKQKCTITKAFNELLEFGIKFYKFAEKEGIDIKNLEEVVKSGYAENKQTRTNNFNNSGRGFI